WIGLSLHHLQTADKEALMRDVRAAIEPNGLFLIYEPASREGESRDAYLDRFEKINKLLWAALTPDEWRSILKHVRTADFPESSSGWSQLGRGAGFARVQELFVDPTKFETLFCLQP